MNLMDKLSSQCRRPSGILGEVICALMNTANKKMYDGVSKLINGDESTNILEIGYGNGKLTKMLYNKTGGTVCGVAVSEDMLKSAERRNKNGVRADRVKLGIGDCCKLPYNDGVFDFAVTINTIYFWSDTLIGLKEIRRTLKDGGAFYNVVYSKKALKTLPYTKTNFKFFEKNEYARLGFRAGFSRVSCKSSGEILIFRYIK